MSRLLIVANRLPVTVRVCPDGVEVDLSCCLNVRSAADERAARTALMLDVLRLADRMRVRLGDMASTVPALGAAAD